MKWNLTNKKEDYLYHFTKSDTAIFKIIPTEKLRLNEFVKTNDPREYKSFGFGGVNADFDEANYIEEYKREQEIISTKLKANCKILSFCEDYHLDNEWWDGFNLSRMWAQYGENHQGVCLVIDRKVFLEENQDIINSNLTFINQIKYTNKNDYPFVNFKELRENGDNYVDNFIKANYQYLYFHKNRDWETEHEVRLIHFSKDETFYSIKNSLKKVILGLAFEKDKLRILLKLIDQSKLRKADYDDGMIKYFRFREEYLERVREGN